MCTNYIAVNVGKMSYFILYLLHQYYLTTLPTCLYFQTAYFAFNVNTREKAFRRKLAVVAAERLMLAIMLIAKTGKMDVSYIILYNGYC